MLKLHNTLTKQEEIFVPMNPSLVTVYCCGPTVYDFAHIGNFRTYTMTDLLVRTLKYIGFPVKYVSNITDVGHLVSDGDTGEDKLEKGAKREGKTAWDIAKFYTDAFLVDSKKLNLLEPDVRPKPTEHIPEQIAMVADLLQKGFAYTIDDGIYFDTSKFPSYGALTGQNLEELKEGARVEANPQKKNATDFALWKFSYPQGRDHDDAIDTARRDMEWPSPWGVGFPGWHIECSAMSKKHLGDQIDIHTGGADLIPIHHTNEIAQSEAATGKVPFVKYWVHGQFIMAGGEKMSKSKGNFYRLADILEKGYDPLALRYLYMSAQYRSYLNFTWQGLDAAAASLKQLRQIVSELQTHETVNAPVPDSEVIQAYRNAFRAALENDLNMPQALAIVWKVAKASDSFPAVKYTLLCEFDAVLGLHLDRIEVGVQEVIPAEITTLLKSREEARLAKQFDESDSLRKQIEDQGYKIIDTKSGATVRKI